MGGLHYNTGNRDIAWMVFITVGDSTVILGSLIGGGGGGSFMWRISGVKPINRVLFEVMASSQSIESCLRLWHQANQ